MLWNFEVSVFFMVLLRLVLLKMINGVLLFSFSDIFLMFFVYCFINWWLILVELVNDSLCISGLLVSLLLIVFVELVIMLNILVGMFVWIVSFVSVSVENGV